MFYDRPLTPSQLEDVTILDDQSTPFTEIAAATGLPLRAVQNHLLTRERIAHDYATDQAVTTLYAHYGMNIATYYALLTKYGIPRRRSTTSALYNKSLPATLPAAAEQRKRNLERAVEMYQAGAKLVAIVRETGINQPSLHAHLARLNIPLRRPPSDANPPLSPADLALAQDLRMKGVPMSRIARDLNITIYNLRMQLSKVKPNE